MQNTGNIQIALADDHVVLRKGLVKVIEGFGNTEVVLDCDNGQQLINLLPTVANVPDVIILDVKMPELDGSATAAAISLSYPEAKILAFSMDDTDETIIRMLKAGAKGYVLKDVDPTELHRAILHLFHYGFYYSDRVTGRLMHKLQTAEGEPQFTTREMTFLEYCCTEMTYKEIAAKMHVSLRTVDGYREALFKKMQITNRIGLALFAIKAGIVKL